jgi:hypothetical protein
MKKQFLIFASLLTLVIASCSKEDIEAPQTDQPEEFAGVMSTANKGKGNPLDAGLVGRFEFDGNLNDKTGQLSPGVSTVGRVSYAADRKGNVNSSIHFNGAYGVHMYNVPLDTNMSVSLWIKKDVVALINGTPFVEGLQSFSFMQAIDQIHSGYFNLAGGTSQGVLGPSMDNSWHHIAATRDANSFKYFIDGVLIGTSPTPEGSAPPDVVNDWILGYGYNAGYKYWYGRLDDLRIYNRVLTSVEINKLSGF